MNRREALAKATVTTADAAAGLLDPEQATRFLIKLKDRGKLSSQMRQEIRQASTGEINKMAVGGRIIRAATENADDGYRAGATFTSLGYTTTKIRLPWEVTEDVFHENIEGQRLERTLMDEMTQQFSYDLEDLDINGDTADVSADAPFLTIDDGLVKLIAASGAAHNIDGSLINGGVWDKSHMFEALNSLPNVYRNDPGLRWIMSPARKLQWWESIVDRDPASGQDLLLGNSPVLDRPLGIPILDVPAFPSNQVVLANPKNFVRVVSWQVRRRRVTGDTDAELAAKDKRFYVFFIKRDVIVQEYDAIARVHTLDAP
jgi:hypothetical protein